MFIFGQFGASAPEPNPEPNPEDFQKRLKQTSHIAPDFASQFESLLDQVWKSEREQDLIRQIDQAVAAEEFREQVRRRAKK